MAEQPPPGNPEGGWPLGLGGRHSWRPVPVVFPASLPYVTSTRCHSVRAYGPSAPQHTAHLLGHKPAGHISLDSSTTSLLGVQQRGQLEMEPKHIFERGATQRTPNPPRILFSALREFTHMFFRGPRSNRQQPLPSYDEELASFHRMRCSCKCR